MIKRVINFLRGQELKAYNDDDDDDEDSDMPNFVTKVKVRGDTKSTLLPRQWTTDSLSRHFCVALMMAKRFRCE